MGNDRSINRDKLAGNSARDPFDGRWHAYVDGKSYGPYTGHHIRTMAAANEILDTDLVCSDGGTAWVQAKDDPVLRLLFSKNAATKPIWRGPAAKRGRQINAAAGMIVLFLLGWLAWPYFALYGLSIAIRDGDVTGLESRINWERVRQGLRADLNLSFLKSSAKEQNELGRGLAVLFGPALINQMVDGYITPQAIGSLIRNGKPNLEQIPRPNSASLPPSGTTMQQSRPANEITFKQLKYAFFDRGPFSFRVDVQPDGNMPTTGLVTLLFSWSGDWKVTRIILPLDEIQEASEKPSTARATDVSTASPPQSPETILSRLKPQAADNPETWGSMFKSQVERCWKKPPGGAETSMPEAAFVIRLNRDGTLQGSPVPEKSPSTSFGRTYQDSALRAIIACQPYSLPASHFDEWKYFAPVFTEQRLP